MKFRKTERKTKKTKSSSSSPKLFQTFIPRIELLEERALLSSNLLVTFNDNQQLAQGYIAVQANIAGQSTPIQECLVISPLF